MIINIGFNFLSKDCVSKKPAIIEVSKAFNNSIASNYYGESIEQFLIGLIAVEPIYDAFAKPRRPRYTEHKETMAFGSIPIVIHKTLEIEIKLDFEQFLAAEDKELQKMVAIEVLKTLHSLKLPKKVTDFDKSRFVKDVEALFQSKYLIE